MDVKILEKSGFTRNRDLFGEEFWSDKTGSVCVYLDVKGLHSGTNSVSIDGTNNNGGGTLSFQTAEELATMLRLCKKYKLANEISSNLK